jgi:acetate kinase
VWRGVPQAAVFDTGFHASLPEHAWRYAVEPARADRLGIRRYGFHGLAHESIMEQVAAALGRPATDIRLVSLQLGGGCSAAAIDRGRSIDTSMGMTPLEGLMMATRSGDVDPALPGYLARREGVDVAEVERWLNEASGLLGVSGRSADVRDLLASEAAGDARASLALRMYCYRIRKQVGGYLAAMGGADAIAFGGGVGEHQPMIRARALEGLEWAGVRLDAALNAQATGGDEPARISADGTSTSVWAVPVDEELVIAHHTLACLLPSR